MEFSISQIAEYLNGIVEGDGAKIITALAKIEEGKEGTLSFLANPKYTPYIYETNASVVIVNKDFVNEKEIKATLIRVDDAYSSFAKLLELYNADNNKLKGISRKAKIHRTAKIGKNVFIGDFVSIAEGVTIGDNTIIHPNVTIYKHAIIKNDCLIYAGVIILDRCVVGNNNILQPGAVIGCDGFGFAPVQNGKYMKIPQTGNVVLEDNVEIGSNATIDRATMGSTYIRKGAKIDNLIQIGHNCDIGSDSVVAGQSGIAGSTTLGSNCMVGGQTGIVGHLKIGKNVKIAAKSGIFSDIPDNKFLMGYPAIDATDYKRSAIHYKNFDKLVKKMNDLERRLKEFENKDQDK